MATIAHWLVLPNFLGAMEAGTAAGERARATDIARSEAADRLRYAYDSLAAKEEQAAQLAAQKHELAKAAMELRAQQMQGLQDYRQGLLSAKENELGLKTQRAGDLYDYRNAMLGLQTDKLNQAQQSAEALRAARAESDAWRQKVAEGTLATRQAEEARKVAADKLKAAGAFDWSKMLNQPPESPKPSLWNRLFGGGTPSPSSAGTSLSSQPSSLAPTTDRFPPAPKDPSKRTVGTTYRTPKGLHTWNGEHWEEYTPPSHDEELTPDKTEQ